MLYLLPTRLGILRSTITSTSFMNYNHPTLFNPTYYPNTNNDFGELSFYNVNDQHVQPKQLDFIRLQPNFGVVPVERIKHTSQRTTQYARLDTCLRLRKHFNIRFPAANVPRLDKIVATDTLFLNIPTLDDGILGHLSCTQRTHGTNIHPNRWRRKSLRRKSCTSD